ncbi:MAG: hypothetical protein HON65_16920 [Rhodospirillales bacterium]|jgi:hypothetical protein|nr:hypothetical protein [Rhodospirillales bacterium]
MTKETIEKVFGVAASLLVMSFVLGLAHSISTGFAGFWGGFPFWVISLFVLVLVFYDFWDSCFSKKQ